MNWKVKKITKISQDALNSGIDIHIAMQRFIRWCGEDFVFLSWGYDDIPMLRTNLNFFMIDAGWIPEFYNIQLFFNQQTENRGRQYSLDFAAEYFRVRTDKEAHDAFNDAYHTALVCEHLDLEYGVQEYGDIMCGNIVLGDGYRAERACDASFGTVKSIDSALGTRKVICGSCPVCKKRLEAVCTVNLTDYRHYTLCRCKKHGEFAVALKFSRGRGKVTNLLRNVYTVDTVDIETKFTEWKQELSEKNSREATGNNGEIQHE